MPYYLQNFQWIFFTSLRCIRLILCHFCILLMSFASICNNFVVSFLLSGLAYPLLSSSMQLVLYLQRHVPHCLRTFGARKTESSLAVQLSQTVSVVSVQIFYRRYDNFVIFFYPPVQYRDPLFSFVSVSHSLRQSSYRRNVYHPHPYLVSLRHPVFRGTVFRHCPSSLSIFVVYFLPTNSPCLSILLVRMSHTVCQNITVVRRRKVLLYLLQSWFQNTRLYTSCQQFHVYRPVSIGTVYTIRSSTVQQMNVPEDSVVKSNYWQKCIQYRL